MVLLFSLSDVMNENVSDAFEVAALMRTNNSELIYAKCRQELMAAR